MLKISGLVEVDNTKRLKGYILTADNKLQSLDGTELVPVDSRIAINSSTVTELGKQLLKAAGDGNAEELKSLLTKGAPFTADWLGTSPLHLAAQNNHLEVCEILLRAGICKDSRTKVDRTALHMAAYEGNLDIVETLCNYGADIDCRDMLGMTPLHWATQNGHFEIVQCLIKMGATINVANKFNLRPTDIAAQINRRDILDFIESYSSDPSIAAQNLVLQLGGKDNENEDNLIAEEDNSNLDGMTVPVEPMIITGNFENENVELDSSGLSSTSNTNFNNIEEEDTSQSGGGNEVNFSAIKILQEHGITLLNTDSDDNILNSVMENGHSVVLTDIGKQVLNSVKSSETFSQPQPKRIITISPEEFLSVANNSVKSNSNVLNRIKVLPMKPGFKRIVMKKNRVNPVSSQKIEQKDVCKNTTDLQTVMSQLIEARKTIEEYKIKLHKKEQEAERYKMQLRLLMDPS